MPEQTNFLKFHTVKDYIKETLKLRSAKEAVEQFTAKFDSLIVTVLKESARLAEEDKRKTIMLEDITPAYEKHIGKRHLTWQEILDEVFLQTPADLGKISKAIDDHIAKEKKK